VLIDRAVSGDSISADAGDYTMYAVLLATAVGLALIIAVRTRRLAESGARAAVAAVRAGQGLHTLLRDHHDLRTVVSSAQINADLLARGATGDALAEVVGHLREDLGELRAQLDAVKGRALEELAGLEEARPAAADVAAAAVAVALASRFPDIDVRVAAGGAPAAMVAGGEATLRRILANLVVNACEGDGRRGARRVEISARPGDGARVVIEIVDDGPGLPAHVLAAAPGTAGSTKPAGLGLGLGLVHGLVKASGGTVAWHNRDGGGARVTVELPAIR
jgi:signal transduction histidine kinase